MPQPKKRRRAIRKCAERRIRLLSRRLKTPGRLIVMREQTYRVFYERKFKDGKERLYLAIFYLDNLIYELTMEDGKIIK